MLLLRTCSLSSSAREPCTYPLTRCFCKATITPQRWCSDKVAINRLFVASKAPGPSPNTRFSKFTRTPPPQRHGASREPETAQRAPHTRKPRPTLHPKPLNPRPRTEPFPKPAPYHARFLEGVRHKSISPKARCFKSHPAPPQALQKPATPFNTLAPYPPPQTPEP